MSVPARGGALLFLTALLGGCAPALDWRDVRPAGAAMQLQFPCRPASQQRQVPLAGAPVLLTLYACDAAGLTFALALADVADPARVAPALAELAAASARNVGAPASGGRAQQPPGATPHAGNLRYTMAGQRPDGRPARVALLVFTRGTMVFQATVLGEQLNDDAVETFFGSLRAGS